jgi:hypothetical protein
MTGLANIYQQSLSVKLYFCTVSNPNRNGGKFRKFADWMLVKLFLIFFAASPG